MTDEYQRGTVKHDPEGWAPNLEGVAMTVQTPYIERDCVFEHEGRSFESGGAVVTPEYAIAYPADRGLLTDWHGRRLGFWRIVASWPIRSYIGSRMYQIEAVIDGVTYTGRGFGAGMIWKGRRKAGQPIHKEVS